MTEPDNVLTQLFTACMNDDTLKARFLSEPKVVLSEYGLDIPEGIEVKLVENADDLVHITLPAPPTAYAGVSDEELGDAAGGSTATGATICCYTGSPCLR